MMRWIILIEVLTMSNASAQTNQQAVYYEQAIGAYQTAKSQYERNGCKQAATCTQQYITYLQALRQALVTGSNNTIPTRPTCAPVCNVPAGVGSSIKPGTGGNANNGVDPTLDAAVNAANVLVGDQDDDVAKTLNNLGLVTEMAGNNELASMFRTTAAGMAVFSGLLNAGNTEETNKTPELPGESFYNAAQTYYLSNEYAKALDYYKKAAEAGYIIGNVGIGDMYNYGRGIKEDNIEAAKWYKIAADKGNADAIDKLYALYAFSDDLKNDLHEAFIWAKKDAELGIASASYSLATMYQTGRGVTQNYDEALKWYNVASKDKILQPEADKAIQLIKQSRNTVAGDNPKQLYELGENYVSLGDNTNARIYLTRAAELGYAHAQARLAEFYYIVEKDKEQAFRWAAKAAENGDTEGEKHLADFYAKGIGTPPNQEEAFKWYKKAADQQDPLSQYNVASCYYNGQGTPKNDSLALKYMLASANNRYLSAQYFIAKTYDVGVLNEKNTSEALNWYSKAATNFHNNDKPLQDPLLELLRKDDTRINSLVEEAAEETSIPQGRHSSSYTVGYLYYEGIGAHKNYSEAFKWFAKGEKMNDGASMLMVALMYAQGQGVTQNAEEALIRFRRLKL